MIVFAIVLSGEQVQDQASATASAPRRDEHAGAAQSSRCE